MKQAEWHMSRVTELDLTSTELSADCLQDILCRAGAGFTYLGLGYCEFFNDQVCYTSDEHEMLVNWLNRRRVGLVLPTRNYAIFQKMCLNVVHSPV